MSVGYFPVKIEVSKSFISGLPSWTELIRSSRVWYISSSAPIASAISFSVLSWAHDKTENEIADAIGADELIYQTLEDLISSVQEGNPEIKDFETSIFTGKYPTDIDDGYLQDLEETRSDIVKMSEQKEAT